MIVTAGLYLVACLASLLFMAAAHKLFSPDRLSVAAAGLLGISASQGLWASRLAALVEVSAATALLLPSLRALGGLLAASLWTSYGILLLWRGRSVEFDCGCSLTRPKSGAHGGARLVHPIALAVLASLVATWAPTGALSFECFVAGIAFLSLYVAAGEAFALMTPKEELVQ